jgi:hypothetical protein
VIIENFNNLEKIGISINFRVRKINPISIIYSNIHRFANGKNLEGDKL